MPQTKKKMNLRHRLQKNEPMTQNPKNEPTTQTAKKLPYATDGIKEITNYPTPQTAKKLPYATDGKEITLRHRRQRN